jgi:hypothetical protein
MTDFESKALADLSVLKSQIAQLIGIGMPGRIDQIEARVQRHEQAVQRMKGLAAAFGSALTIVHLSISYLSGKR